MVNMIIATFVHRILVSSSVRWLGDKRYNLGAIIARRLHLNAKDGDLFGGIYATRLANYLGVHIRGYDIELPPAFLDYEAMVRYQFLKRNE